LSSCPLGEVATMLQLVMSETVAIPTAAATFKFRETGTCLLPHVLTTLPFLTSPACHPHALLLGMAHGQWVRCG
jgi:hypothetical protein